MSTICAKCGHDEFIVKETTIHLLEYNDNGELEITSSESEGFGDVIACDKCGTIHETEADIIESEYE
jgi:predicted nucleic-acid-binding Zn-ribbon protein